VLTIESTEARLSRPMMELGVMLYAWNDWFTGGREGILPDAEEWAPLGLGLVVFIRVDRYWEFGLGDAADETEEES
jgi:hypothetical protein